MVVFLCGGSHVVVVVAVHGGDGRLCVAAVVLLYDCVCVYGG